MEPLYIEFTPWRLFLSCLAASQDSPLESITGPIVLAVQTGTIDRIYPIHMITLTNNLLKSTRKLLLQNKTNVCST